MTITSNVTAIQIPGNGSATVFAAPMKIFAATDLVIGFIIAGAYVAQVSGYGVSNIDVNGGCTITFTTPPPLGTTVDIRTVTPETQGTEFANLGAYLPENTTDTCDRIVRMVQDLSRRTYDYGIHGPDSEITPWPALPIPSLRKGYGLLFDAITGLPTLGFLSAQNITIGLLAPLLALSQTPAEAAAGVTPTNFAYAPGDVRRYGADSTGLVDSTAAFVSAFLVKGNIIAVGTFKISTTVIMDISTTTITGPGKIVSGLAANGGGTFKIVASAGVESNTYHKISQLYFSGQNLTGVQAIDFNTVIDAVDCFTVESCTFYNFADGVKVTNVAWEIEFHGCTFSTCGSDHAGLYVPFVGSERVSCVQCAFFNSTECVRIDGGGEIFLDNCSLDYSVRLINAQFGNVFAVNCYIENGATPAIGDADYWFKTGVGDATLILSNCMIAQTMAKTNFAIAQSLSGSGGTLDFRNCKLYSNTDIVVNPIIAGSGNSRCSGTLIDGFSDNRRAWSHFSAASNFGSNGTFANGSGGLGGWTVASTGGSLPTAAGNTLLLQTSGGGFGQSAYWTLAAEPGQNVGFNCNMKGNVTGCSFSMVIRAVGADGVTIATTTAVPGFNNFNGSSFPCPTAYTAARANFLNLPPGTATVQLEFNTAGNTASTNIVSIQGVVIGKY